MLGPFHRRWWDGLFLWPQVAPCWTFAGRSMFEVTLFPSRNTGPHRTREKHGTVEPDQGADQGDQDAAWCDPLVISDNQARDPSDAPWGNLGGLPRALTRATRLRQADLGLVG